MVRRCQRDALDSRTVGHSPRISYSTLLSDALVDGSTVGADEAKRNLVVNAVVKLFFDPSFGVGSIADSTVTGWIGHSGLYEALDARLADPVLEEQILQIAAGAGVQIDHTLLRSTLSMVAQFNQQPPSSGPPTLP
jgi:hypothetical protein